jgi:hypothetical protein
MHFHYNASLTSVNIAKCKAIREKVPLSMASIKVLMHNEFLLNRFIALSGIRPNKRIIENYGWRA